MVRRASGELRLPEKITARLFDTDGVLSDTAQLHAAAWEQIFDAYLHERATRTGETVRLFGARADYEQFVDGKSRSSVRSFRALRV